MELKDVQDATVQDLKRYANAFEANVDFDIRLARAEPFADLDAIGRAQLGHYQLARAAHRELQRRAQVAKAEARQGEATRSQDAEIKKLSQKFKDEAARLNLSA